MPRPMLTARWANLAFITYAVPPAVLAPYTPPGPGGTRLELDTRDDLVAGSRQERACVSLVALRFTQTRAVGVPLPGYGDFTQVNFRFYVRAVGAGASVHRGVVFIREIVPRPLMAWGARKFLNEPYAVAPCTSRVTQDTRTLRAEYAFGQPAPPGVKPARPVHAGDATPYTVSVVGRKPVVRPGPGTLEHFFKERPWAFGVLPARGKTVDPGARAFGLEVIHPAWGVYPVESFDVRVDFGALFGPDWGFLAGMAPAHVMLAAGSEVAAFWPRRRLAVRWGARPGA